MTVAFVCVRCDGCEQMIAARRVNKVAGLNFHSQCAAKAVKRSCPQCGHGELKFHTALGCLYDDNGADCPCGPPALEVPR